MEASHAPRWTRLEHSERRRQILGCARELFSERHFAAVSTDDIAQAAGVRRGLLHHYFGTKRDLYLEVVREMVRVPTPSAEELSQGSVEDRVNEALGRWLTMVERNGAAWLAATGAEGFGRDPDLEEIVDGARELAVERLIELLGMGPAEDASPQLRAALRAYGSMVEAAAREWLENRRLTRDQVQLLLTQTLLQMTRDVLPDVIGNGNKALKPKRQRRK